MKPRISAVRRPTVHAPGGGVNYIESRGIPIVASGIGRSRTGGTVHETGRALSVPSRETRPRRVCLRNDRFF
jgi:hypothetical protein